MTAEALVWGALFLAVLVYFGIDGWKTFRTREGWTKSGRKMDPDEARKDGLMQIIVVVGALVLLVVIVAMLLAQGF